MTRQKTVVRDIIRLIVRDLKSNKMKTAAVKYITQTVRPYQGKITEHHRKYIAGYNVTPARRECKKTADSNEFTVNVPAA